MATKNKIEFYSDLNSVKVIFQNPSYNYFTSVGKNVTIEDAKKYFVGKLFNVASSGSIKDNLQKCTQIQYYQNPKNKGLKGIAKKKVSKQKKSAACSKVLQLMDEDYSYQKALREVLKSDKRLNKAKLEAELDNYI